MFLLPLTLICIRLTGYIMHMQVQPTHMRLELPRLARRGSSNCNAVDSANAHVRSVQLVIVPDGLHSAVAYAAILLKEMMTIAAPSDVLFSLPLQHWKIRAEIISL